MDSRKNKSTFLFILISLFGFVLFQTVLTDAWGYSSHMATKRGSYIYAYLSRLIWVASAGLLIFRCDAFLNIGKKRLCSKPVWNKYLVISLVALLLIPFIGMFVRYEAFQLNNSINIPLEIIKFIIVGFVEETVFRGWGYNALSTVVTDKKAIIYSTALFAVLHWPAYLVKYYRLGVMDFSAMLIQSITAALFGVLFCRLFEKGKSLWNPIIVHIVYDVFTVLLVG